MRLEKKIEQMKHPGMTTFSEDEGFMPAFHEAILKLKRDGHAIIVDTTIDYDHTVADTRVFHYKTCAACSLCANCEVRRG